MFPPTLEDTDGEDGAADLATKLLDSAVDMAMNTGDLSTAGQATSATVDLLNDNKNKMDNVLPSNSSKGVKNYRRALKEYQNSPAGQNRSGLRNRMMDVTSSVAEGSPNTDVSRRSSYQMTASLTSAPTEVGAGLTDKGVALMSKTLSGGNSMDPESGSDATGALSNLLFTANLGSVIAEDEFEGDGRDEDTLPEGESWFKSNETVTNATSSSSPSTNIRIRGRSNAESGRRRYLADNIQPRGLDDASVFNESFCEVDCGYVLNGTFVGR
eukprot:SAG31_NODE_4723_length_3006_cov_10.527214_1_plen_269_part_10